MKSSKAISPDFSIEGRPGGDLYFLRPLTVAAFQWVHTNIPHARRHLGGGIAVDDFVAGIQNAEKDGGQ